MKRIFFSTLSAVCFCTAATAADIAGLTQADRGFLEAEAAKLSATGLDAKPLYNKAREGIAKGVSGDALRKAVSRERELYSEAARIVGATPAGSKNEIAQSVVIAVKRGAKSGDIESAVKQHRQNPAVLISVVDMLGDFARLGITGEKAVRAATDTMTRKAVSPTTGPADNRADVNRAIMQREIQQNLPALRPTDTARPPAEPHNPTGTQGGVIDHKH
ncbi:MAG: hypothetical protein J0L53_05850 [Spirochaetes bacterium]|nr:hypothetical protein [Spirochaetota bacterium]